MLVHQRLFSEIFFWTVLQILTNSLFSRVVGLRSTGCSTTKYGLLTQFLNCVLKILKNIPSLQTLLAFKVAAEVAPTLRLWLNVQIKWSVRKNILTFHWSQSVMKVFVNNSLDNWNLLSYNPYVINLKEHSCLKVQSCKLKKHRWMIA